MQTISRVVTGPSKSATKAKRPEGHRGPRASVFLGSLFRSGTTSWRGGGPHCRTSSRRLSFASKGREKQHRQRSKVVMKRNDQAPTDPSFSLSLPLSRFHFSSSFSSSRSSTDCPVDPHAEIPSACYASISPNLCLDSCSGL